MLNWYKDLSQEIDAQNIGPHAVEALKETRYIEGVIAGVPRKEAALEAGYGARMAHAPAKLIESSDLRAQFQQIAISKGLTLHRVADKISEHLEARANQTLNGKEVTVSDAPDNRVQQKAIEQLTGLLGMQDASKVQAGGSSITLSVSGPAAERLAAMLSGE
jgi:hypothetical protein